MFGSKANGSCAYLLASDGLTPAEVEPDWDAAAVFGAAAAGEAPAVESWLTTTCPTVGLNRTGSLPAEAAPPSPPPPPPPPALPKPCFCKASLTAFRKSSSAAELVAAEKPL